MTIPNPENQSLTYSKQGLTLTEDFEGCKLTAYQDQHGVWTIGYGHTGRDVYKGLTITREHAEALLLNDIKWAETVVKNHVAVKLQQQQFDALVDFTFNVGAHNFERSTLLRELNAGNYVDAALEFLHWDLIAGKVSKGLARRRLSEEELFQHGIVQA